LVPEIALRAADVFAALLEAYRKGQSFPSIQSLRADIARLAHPAGGATQDRCHDQSKEKESRRENQPLVGIRTTGDQRAQWREGKRVHHVVVEIDPQCGMPIAGVR
jgi:hypothetical protein